MIRNLENKVAWITGAGSGIGRDASIKLSELGMKVILSGRIKTLYKILKRDVKLTLLLNQLMLKKNQMLKIFFPK